jgi:hypothetical protein
MKRFAPALMMLGAGLAGCQSVDSRVAVRGDVVSESSPVVSDQESPRPLPIVVRWQNMVARVRESIREDNHRAERSSREQAQGLELTSVGMTVVRQGDAREARETREARESRDESQSSSVVHSGGTDRTEKVKTLPRTTSVVQVGASQPASSTEPKTTVTTANAANAADLPAAPAPASEAGAAKFADAGEGQPSKTPTRVVNSKRIVVDYEIKDVGPSGVSTVDLWYTRDGHKWDKCPVGPQRTSPYILEVREEGTYGITLVASSGIGLKKRPPRPGDAPQIWIEVDTTKPLVRLTGCRVGTGTEADSMTITWKASDKHMTEKPITLSYAEQPDGPWSTIVANMENTGMYVWKMPTNVPQKMVIRMEAGDQAGNVGLCQTREWVMVDLAKPSVAIVNIKPAAN